jgi:hypothetical protein
VPSKTTSISPIDKVCGKKKRQLENKKNVKWTKQKDIL